MENKTHWKKAFKSDYLSSVDLDDKEIQLTIEKVVLKECITASGKKLCNVAYFKEPNIKPMILNVTNSKIVKRFSGGKTHLEEWLNIPIRVYVDSKVKFGSDTVEGLRIRETQPTTQKPELLPTQPAWQKAVEFYKESQSFEKIETKYLISETNKELIKLQSNAN